jgi:hypothetical protein
MNENPSWKATLDRLLDSLREVIESAYWFGGNLALVLVLSAITFPRGGWSEVPLRGMNLVEYRPLLERLWDKPTEEIENELDKVIPEYFRRDDHAPLSEMVGSWYLYGEDRRQVFEDALWAHKQEYYTLSIPALAAQVEGILRELVQKYGGPSNEWETRFYRLLGYDRDQPPRAWTPEEVLPEFLDLPLAERIKRADDLRNHFTLVRINALYEEGDFTNPVFASSVNRHAILHGVFLNFGEVESLKLFFVLDLLHEAVGTYEELAQEILGAVQRAVQDNPHLLRQRTKNVAKELVDGEYLQKELGEHLQKEENIPFLAGVLKTVRAEALQDSGPNTV